MRSYHAIAGSAGVLALLALGAHGCQPPSLHRIHEGPLIYEYSDGLEPCGGTARYLRRSAEFIAHQLRAPHPQAIRFSWLNTEDHLPLPGRLGHPDTALGSNALSSGPYELHELVHVAVTKASAPFLVEGLAVAYGPLAYESAALHPFTGDPEDPRPMITTGWPVPGEYYGPAGRFVQYLLAVHGPEAFMDFYVALGPPWTRATIEARFERAFGLTLDEEVALFLDRSSYPETCVFDIEPASCGAPPSPRRGDAWGASHILACESPEVVGGLGGSHTLRSFIDRTITIEEDGDYRLRALGDAGTGVRLAACFGCPWGRTALFLESPEERTLSLEAGRYYVRMSAEPGEALDVGFSLVRLETEAGSGASGPQAGDDR